MVLLPTPLKAFTDTMPDVKKMLRICAFNLYGWKCDHDELLSKNKELDFWNDWNSYPDSWPRSLQEKLPRGIVELSPTIQESAEKRLRTIRQDLESAGNHYPTEEVKKALEYWKIRL